MRKISLLEKLVNRYSLNELYKMKRAGLYNKEILDKAIHIRLMR